MPVRLLRAKTIKLNRKGKSITPFARAGFASICLVLVLIVLLSAISILISIVCAVVVFNLSLIKCLIKFQ